MTYLLPKRGLRLRGALLAALCLAAAARADDAPATADAAPEQWSLHGQATTVLQYHAGFRSPYAGLNSLSGDSHDDETTDLTLFAGARLWQGAAFYLNPEVDQGYGLSDTLGLAGFSSGEAYKVGSNSPYARLHRAFLRQVIGLGTQTRTVVPDANQLGGPQPVDSLTLTLGKFSVGDIFDTNAYAHDPRGDFLNWALIDAGAFDYAADAWGYSYGAALEWAQSWWTARAGVFDLSRVPNSRELQRGFGQFALIGELEERHTLWGRDGKLKLLAYMNRGRMADYDQALAQADGGVPDVSLVRRYRSRPGVALNLEQALAADLGGFVRASLNDGSKEAYEFTEINRSVSAGLSLKGARWGRPDDTVGLAGVANGLSSPARAYFAAGGMGILIGDGKLPDYGLEKIVEAYYSVQVLEPLSISLDYQFVDNPAYNRDRGPVSIIGLRVHLEM